MRALSLTVSMLFVVAASSVYSATVLIGGEVKAVAETLSDPTDLWVPVADLAGINGFELKPEGACLDAICVPVQQDRDSDIFVTRQGKAWFNVTELAQRVQQPYVTDSDADVWSFGAIPAQRDSFVRDAKAPDFTLPDWHGNQVSLSDFKGKKVMLLTWASW